MRERTVDIPFILVSGKVGEETAVQAMKAGADDYILKGDLARLVPMVARACAMPMDGEGHATPNGSCKSAMPSLPTRIAWLIWGRGTLTWK